MPSPVLESLSICSQTLTYTTYPNPSLPKILGDFTWTRLNYLSLSDFVIAAKQLINIFERHRSILRKLSIQHILLTSGTWEIVFRELRGGILRDVEVCHLAQEGHDEDHFDFLDASWMVPFNGSSSFIPIPEGTMAVGYTSITRGYMKAWLDLPRVVAHYAHSSRRYSRNVIACILRQCLRIQRRLRKDK